MSRVVAWYLASLAVLAGAAGAVEEVEFIRVSSQASSAEVRVLSSGRPGVIGTQLDQDGFLVLELADHRPARDLQPVPALDGLVAGVEVGLHEGEGGVATRILIRTRGRAMHTIALEGSLVRLDLRRVAAEPPPAAADSSRLEERIQTTSTALAESEESRAVLIAQIETMSKANRQLVQLFEELEGRRGQLESGLEKARHELTRLREERAVRDAESAQRLAEHAAREKELDLLVDRLNGEVAEAESARSELTRRLEEMAAQRAELDRRLLRATTQEEALAQQVEELTVSLEQAAGEVERYRASGVLRGRTTAEVNLRAGPGTDQRAVGSLAAETVAEVLSRGPEWLQVRVGDRQGWVAADFFVLEDDELSSARQRVEQLEAELDRSRSESTTLGEQLARAEAERQDLGGERQRMAADLEAARAEVARLEEAGEERAGELGGRLEAAAAREADLESRLAELAARHDVSQQNELGLEERLRTATAERQALAGRLAEAVEQRRELESRAGALEERSRQLAASLEQAEGEVERYRAEGLVRGRVTARVNLRAGPGIDQQVLGSLAAETVAEVLSRGEEWLQVRQGDRQGWVSAEYFVVEEDELSQQRRRVAELESELSQSRGESASLGERLARVEGEREELGGQRQALVAELEAARADLARRTAAGDERAGRLSAELEQATTREVELERRLSELSSQYEASQGSEGELTKRLEEVVGEQEEMADRWLEATAREAELERRLSELSARYDASQGSEGELTSRLEEVVGEQARMADRLLEAAAREEGLVRRVEALTAEVTEARESEAGLSQRLAETDAARAELERRLTEASGRDRALEARVAGLDEQLEAGRAVEEELRLSLEESGSARSQLEQRLEAVTGEGAALAADVETLVAEQSRLSAELAASRQEVERYREQGALRGRATANVNLRSGPGLQFERLGLLPAESVMEVLSRGDGWVQVRSDDRRGWVSADYFELEGDELGELAGRVAELESELALGQERGASLAERLATITAERDLLATDLEGARQALAERDTAAADRVAELDARLEAAQGRGSELARRVEELESELAGARQAEARLTAGMAEADAARSELAGQVAELTAERAVLEAQASSLATTNQELFRDLEEAVGAVESYRELGLVRAHAIAGVNLRSGPGIDFERIAVLPVETVAEVLNRGEGWLRVRVGGLEGWVSGDYMRLDNDEVTALRGSVAELSAQVGAMERAGRELLGQLETSRGEQDRLAEQLELAARREQELQARVGELDGRLAQAESSGRQLGESVTRAEGERDRLAARLESVSGERSDLESRVESLDAERLALAGRVATLSGELETTRGALDRLAEAAEVTGAVAAEPVGGPRAAVEAWAAAWSNRNVERYLSFYASEYRPPDGASRSSWEAQRRARIERPTRIRIELSDLEVTDLAAGRALASFTQSYESDLFQDQVAKLLELVSEDGRWKIVRERLR